MVEGSVYAEPRAPCAESGGRWVEHAVARLHRLACAEGACLL